MINTMNTRTMNFASRDRLDGIEQRVSDMEHRLKGLSYIVRKIAFNKRIEDEDIQTIEDRIADDSNISVSAE